MPVNRAFQTEGGFADVFRDLDLAPLLDRAGSASPVDFSRTLHPDRSSPLDRFAALISPAAGARLEELAQESQQLTRKHFGKTIRLFAPIYLSNECVNICTYCGFSRNNPIPRVTLAVEQVEREVAMLHRQGFRSLLIVAGEHPKFVSNGYVVEVVKRCLEWMPSLAIELGPMPTVDYMPVVQAGCEGLTVYQETYHKETYESLHTAGPKKHFYWRMDTPERGYQAGFRRLGIGALFGLYDWRYEALALAAHALYLHRHCWQSQLTISFPRMRPAAGGFQPDPAHVPTDRELVQLICAFRLLLPHAGIVVSTREHPSLRNGLVPLGTTHMSAGSSTEPGGYSTFDETNWAQCKEDQPGEQFHIADERPPAMIAAMIRQHGYDPVWKDHDQCFTGEGSGKRFPGLTTGTLQGSANP